MRIRIQMVIENEEAEGVTVTTPIEEIACLLLLRDDQPQLENLGLSLAEAKQMLASVQTQLVNAQANNYLNTKRTCPHCAKPYIPKGQQPLTFRTLFGTLKLSSPRFYTCQCSAAQATSTTRSFSPLVKLVTERSSPELVYLQTKWASLMSYGLTSQLLAEVLPLAKPVSTAVLSQNVHKVAQRSENELGEEQFIFAEGCPAEWEALPHPDAPLTIGIDGGYVRGRDGADRKTGNFEVIVGKSMPQTGPNKRFGFVNSYDTKPKRRLFELLKSQGMQMNQKVIFLSDGGDTVRDLQLYLNPQAEHLLDWFHVTMRLTVLKQYTKGLPPPKVSAEKSSKSKSKWTKEVECSRDEAEQYPSAAEIEQDLESIKWYLWHGNAYKSLQLLHDLEEDLELLEPTSSHPNQARQKLYNGVREFKGYITANQKYIVNYGDRYRNEETISSAFVESTVNEVISHRFVKKQQMRWTKQGVHELLQVRVAVLNEQWRETFERWYPGMPKSQELKIQPELAQVS